MRCADTNRVSRRRVPADADERVTRCGGCGAWRYDESTCRACTLLAARRLAERLQVLP